MEEGFGYGSMMRITILILPSTINGMASSDELEAEDPILILPSTINGNERHWCFSTCFRHFNST